MAINKIKNDVKDKLILYYNNIMNSEVKIFIIIFSLSLIIRLILYYYINLNPYSYDGNEYLEWGSKIPNLKLFFIVTKKPPLYPFLLGIFNLLGISDKGIIFLQICLDSMNQILFYFICRTFANRVFSFWACFSYLINFSLIKYSFYFQTETLSVFLLMSHALILLKYKEKL